MVAAFDEMKGHDGGVRPAYGELARWLGEVPPDVLDYRRREAELLFRRIGITFAVYGEADAQERLIPFDVIPRILAGAGMGLLAAASSSASRRSTPSSRTSTARAKSCAPASCRKIWSSRTRCSARR